jgi:DNA-binding transcriptional LysR family regulator
MDITLRQIRCFLAIARCGSFTQAAQLLHLSQPTLTAQVKQLESRLALRLIDRSTHHVRLTPAGAAFLPLIENVVKDLDVATNTARKAGLRQKETIRFACFPSFASTILPNAVAAFRHGNPSAFLALRDIDGQRVITAIRSEEVECGVSHVTGPATDLDYIPLLNDELQVVYPENHPIGRLRKIRTSDVAEYPLIILKADENNSRVMIDAAFGGTMFLAAELTYTSSVIAMVEAGMGIAILPALALKLNPRGPLRTRRIENTTLARHICLITKRGITLSPATKAFIEILVAESKRYKVARGNRPEKKVPAEYAL